MENIFVCKATKQDVECLAKLESELISPVSIQSVENAIESESLVYFVLKENEKIIGFLEGSIISPDAELYDIGIVAEFQGRGLSKKLLDEFIKFCRENNCETIFLEVNNINIKAINLYKKFGFAEYNIRKNYYGSNDAILMKLKI